MEQIITDFLNGMSYDDLCKKYHHKFSTIKKILKENNIDTSSRDRKEYKTNKRISKQTINNICEDYNYGFSLNKLSKKYNIGVEKIKKILIKQNITIRPVSAKKYLINENYFDNIGSNQAYILGFFAADGWNRKRDNLLELTLQQSDIEILERIKEKMGMSREIRQFTTKDGCNKASLTFSSKKIKEIFEKYGIVPNKTFKLKHLPELPKEYLRDYIRGYFDGDGSIYFSRSSLVWTICSVNKSFLEEIMVLLNKELNIPLKTIYEDKRKEHILYSFQYWNKEELKKIYNFLYPDNVELFLVRKKEKFESIFE